MRLFRGSHHTVFAAQGCVATIGNFDGVHQGHQKIITQLRKLATQLNRSTAVIVFEPLPAAFFQVPDAVRIYTFRQRLEIIQAAAIDYVICLRFNQHLAQMSPRQFVQKILIDGLHVRGLVIGEDFRFGDSRSGDYTILQEAAEEYGFTLQQVSAIGSNQQRVSSSWIRDLIAAGEFTQVQQLLGRPFEVKGHVIHGHKQGTALGFPTANLAYGRMPTPLRGVYVGTVTSLKPAQSCLINAGYRPTFQGKRYCLEVHIPNFSADLYGQVLSVRLVKKVRDERKFDSSAALKQQIHQDLEAVNK